MDNEYPPRRLSVIGIEAPGGLRTLELLEGDITRIPCDLLVLSAFKGSYAPAPGSVLGALWDNHGLTLIDELSPARLIDQEFDLRDQFGIWATRTLDNLPCRRILCVEMKTRYRDGNKLLRQLEESLENVFVGVAILEAKGMAIHQLAMPLLGTGYQRLDEDAVVPHLIAKTREAIARSTSLERVMFVVNRPDKALLLQRAIDDVFGVVGPKLPKAELIAALLSDMEGVSLNLLSATAGPKKKMATEMLELARSTPPDAASVGLLARRLAESVTDSLSSGMKDIDLYKKIESLPSRGISPWMVSYLHTLRVIGNEVVHIRDPQDRTPPMLGDDDLALCLFCIQRVAQFWLVSLQG